MLSFIVIVVVFGTIKSASSNLDAEKLNWRCYSKVFDENFRNPYPNVTRYYSTLVNQPSFKKVMDDVELCKEAIKYSGKCMSSSTASVIYTTESSLTNYSYSQCCLTLS